MKYKLVMVSMQYSPGKYRTTFLRVPVSSDGKVRVPWSKLSTL